MLEYMQLALELAREAAERGEVPVGAVVVRDDDGAVIGRGYNMREERQSPAAHAEMIAIEDAAKTIGSWRLCGCTLYVTLEPCPMCMGAIINARIGKVVFGAFDKAAGCCGSVVNMAKLDFQSKPELLGGIMEDECAVMLGEFFRELRQN